MRVAGAVCLAALGVAGGCSRGTASAGHPDARVDAFELPEEAITVPPHRHTIALDGIDDFTGDETFGTTSTTFTARITWDDANLYVGYSGPDLSTTVAQADTKWLFVYLDTIAGGETQSEMYNTQRVTFPSGFAADDYARYKVDGTLTSLQHVATGVWSTVAPAPATAQSGTFVELAIPLSSIGSPSSVGIVTWMINEKMLAEGTFAGLYADNFGDGYAANLALTRYVVADFSSPRAPNDLGARQP
jgi:hypothetical protein